MKQVIDILRKRGLFDNMTSPDLPRVLQSPVTLYAGFDPSARSLQLGNLVTVMALAHFQRCGHKVIALVGGTTGMIGDPSGKTSERKMLGLEDIEKNLAGIRENLSRFLDFEDARAPARIVNNNDWLGRVSFVDFLRDVGKYFRMGSMLGKESVRARMESEDGMSFAEFSYQMLQAYDFLHLNNEFGCVLQIGGSDQWGNITAGIDLVRKVKEREVFGMTIPLACDSSGRKFGKSEAGALYLDSAMTSVYDFYQFLVRTEDADVVRFLKILTFLEIDEINNLGQEVMLRPEKRLAQKTLAELVTKMVHGNEGLKLAQRASSVLFGESMEGLHAKDLIGIFADVPSIELQRAKVEGASMLDIAVASGLCKSKGEARRLVENRGFYVNNRRIENVLEIVSFSDIIDGSLVVLKSGKKTFRLVKVI